MPTFFARPAVFQFLRNIRPLAVSLGLTLGLGLFQAAPASANTVEEASQSLKAGDHAKALEQINRFLANKPKDAQGRFIKGLILTGLNKPTDAIAVFRKLTEDYPELPEPYNNLAVIYAQQKQYDKAKEALEQAIRTHPAYATAHENLGDIYSRLASQAYGKALQIDGSNASAQTKLAMISDLVGAPVKVGAGKTAVVTAPAQPAVQPPKPVVVAVAPAPVVVEPAKPTVAPPVVAKPEPAKPTEPPKPAAEPKPAAKPADATTEVAAAIDGWLNAWSKKDVRSYLAAYAKDFQTPNGQARKAWETERSQRVGKPGKIEVGRDKLSIKAEGDDKVVVRFRQHYKSANLNTSSGKTLVLVKRDGKWLIQQERVGG
ncbi:MAG: tetratricopeptide repeat protein [Rhodocyclaceae bacterium]|nr:tetratricopeptide repeat protein [Rhodocyclaceae bacterium]MDZ4215605.1 tetratricopeptide repeat protein [Rhodocyclaceae bacterium]